MDKVASALKGTNYSEIARRSGTTPGFVSLLFRGQRRAKVETLSKMAKALGVTLDDLHSHILKLASTAGVKGKPDGWQGGKAPKRTPKAPAPVNA